MALEPLVGLGSFFSFLIFYTVASTSWTGDQSVARTAQTENKRTQTSMPRVGFESTIPVFKLAKKIHVLDSAATVISTYWSHISHI
jgi:hypothetical protein